MKDQSKDSRASCYLTLRLSRSLYQALENEAFAQSRPVSAQARFILDEHFDLNALASLHLADYLKQHKTATRLQLLRQGHFTASELNYALAKLVASNSVSIVLNGSTTYCVSNDTREQYTWIA